MTRRKDYTPPAAYQAPTEAEPDEEEPIKPDPLVVEKRSEPRRPKEPDPVPTISVEQRKHLYETVRRKSAGLGCFMPEEMPEDWMPKIQKSATNTPSYVNLSEEERRELYKTYRKKRSGLGCYIPEAMPDGWRPPSK